MQNNNEQEDRLSLLETKFLSFEKKVNKKLETIYRYKTVQLTIKVLILSSLSAWIFLRSGKNRDASLWIIGIYVLLVSVLELIELEELRFFLSSAKVDKDLVNGDGLQSKRET